MTLLAVFSRQQSNLKLCNSRLLSSFRYEDMQITLTDKPARKPDNDKLKFGAHISDHMLEIDWTEQHGWGYPQIKPVEPLRIHPAAKVLHYATELFEGMKAYRCVDNKIRLFRPMENLKRMSLSAQRTALPKQVDFNKLKLQPGAFRETDVTLSSSCGLPNGWLSTDPIILDKEFDKAELLKCLKKLISVDQEWVPYSQKCSLYIRPTFIGTEPALGVSLSNQAKLFVITGPVGPYFPTGLKPVSLLADPAYVRAWPGGCGMYKMGSNYAPAIAIQDLAVKKYNCQQVLWLFGDDHQMTEVGTMNLFVYWINENGEKELITPPLESGLILPGVTRKSLLELARQWNEFKVSEQDITMNRFIKALNEDRVKEVFGAGTACIVCPVNRILYKGQDLNIQTTDDPRNLTQRFFKEVNDIHFYRKTNSWMETVEENEEEPLRTYKTQ